MEYSIRLFMCVALLSPFAAPAQEEEPAAEVPAEQTTPADIPPVEAPDDATAEAAPAEEAPAESASGEGLAAGLFGGSGHVDVYYAPTSLLNQVAGGTRFEEHGDGAGARGLYKFLGSFAVRGEYESLKYDQIDFTLKNQRLGIGAITENGAGDEAGIFLEYDQVEGDPGEKLNGYGVHGHLGRKPAEWFRFYGELGYLTLKGDTEDQKGPEFTLGGVFEFGHFGAFADVRFTQLTGKDSHVETNVSQARVGVRLNFGGSSQSEP